MADQPKLYKGDRPLNVTAEAVFEAVRGIIASGAADEFLKACKDRAATVTVAADDVNFVKSFLFDRATHEKSVSARRIVDSDQCTAA